MSGQPNNVDPLHPLVRPLQIVGSFWLRISWPVQALLIAFTLIIKLGIDIELRNVQEAYLPGSLLFPQPAGYYSASIAQVLYSRLFALDTPTTWISGHLFITAVALTVAVFLAVRSRMASPAYTLLILATATSTGAILLSIGKYDVFTFLGGVILVLARHNWMAVFGAVLMASAHPEEAILASLALFVLSHIHDLRYLRARAAYSILASTAIWVIVQLWFLSAGLDMGRISLITEFLGESLGNLIVDPIGEVWGWLGIGWLITIASIVLIDKKHRWVIITSLILIPALATIITADGARVFAGISLPAYIVIGTWLAAYKITWSRFAQPVMGAFIILAVILPSGVEKPGWYEGLVRGKIQQVSEQIFH